MRSSVGGSRSGGKRFRKFVKWTSLCVCSATDTVVFVSRTGRKEGRKEEEGKHSHFFHKTLKPILMRNPRLNVSVLQ